MTCAPHPCEPFADMELTPRFLAHLAACPHCVLVIDYLLQRAAARPNGAESAASVQVTPVTDSRRGPA